MPRAGWFVGVRAGFGGGGEWKERLTGAETEGAEEEGYALGFVYCAAEEDG